MTAKFASLFPHLDERQRRLAMGAEARVLGHGGIKLVARAAGASPTTVSKGVAELETGDEPLERTRRSGGGRKAQTVTDPGLVDALLALVEPEERGDPMSPLRWTTKSARAMSQLASRRRRAMNREVIEAARLFGMVLVPCRQVTCRSEDRPA